MYDTLHPLTVEVSRLHAETIRLGAVIRQMEALHAAELAEAEARAQSWEKRCVALAYELRACTGADA